MEQASWDDFMKLDIRSGTITDVAEFPEARKPAYIVSVDFGNEIGIRRCSAQIRDRYSIEYLLGKQVMGVVNFPPKQIGPFMSEFLLTGFYQDDGSVILAVPDMHARNGSRLG